MLDQIPTFVITVPGLPARTAYVRQHFAERGVSWREWSGFPGVVMGLATNKPYYTDNHRETPCTACGNETAYKLGPGTVACTMSHLALYKHIIAAEHPATLIFENDVVLPDDFRERFEAFYAGLPAGWDIGYLGWSSGDLAWDAANVKPVSAGVGIVPGGSMQTHAYMVSLNGARFLDKHCQQAWRPIDVSIMVEGANVLKNYYAWPKIAEQLTASGKQAGSLHFDAKEFAEVEKPKGGATIIANGDSWKYAEEA